MAGMFRTGFVLAFGAVTAACGGRVGIELPDTAGAGGVSAAAGSGGRQPNVAGAPPRATAGGGGSTSASGGFTGKGGAPAGSGGVVIGGAAGSGGVGQQPYICSSKVQLSGMQPIITSFESESTPDSVFFMEGVMGGTYAYADPMDVNALVGRLFVPGRDATSRQALSVRIQSTTWGGGAGVWFLGCVDARLFVGIEFWARGTAPVASLMSLHLTMADTLFRGDGGSCPNGGGTCVAPMLELVLTETWTRFSVRWEDFTPGLAGGAPVRPTGDNLAGMNLHLTNDYTPHELLLELDDIAFLVR
jgi:hypothetical protein